MALSNSQYDHLMRTYEQKQLDNEFQLRKRYEKAYALIPELEEVDHSISSLSVEKARLLLDGDQTALSFFKIRNQRTLRQKAGFIKKHMVFLPITLNYTISVRIVKIPVILAHKCHCFKKRLWIIYIRNLISKISLTKRTFSTFFSVLLFQESYRSAYRTFFSGINGNCIKCLSQLRRYIF